MLHHISPYFTMFHSVTPYFTVFECCGYAFIAWTLDKKFCACCVGHKLLFLCIRLALQLIYWSRNGNMLSAWATGHGLVWYQHYYLVLNLPCPTQHVDIGIGRLITLKHDWVDDVIPYFYASMTMTTINGFICIASQKRKWSTTL